MFHPVLSSGSVHPSSSCYECGYSQLMAALLLQWIAHWTWLIEVVSSRKLLPPSPQDWLTLRYKEPTPCPFSLLHWRTTPLAESYSRALSLYSPISKLYNMYINRIVIHNSEKTRIMCMLWDHFRKRQNINIVSVNIEYF